MITGYLLIISKTMHYIL